MNANIQEFSKLADQYALQMNPEEDSYGRPANPEKYQRDRDARFAKLIAQACADNSRKHAANNTPTLLANMIATSIERMFGIR